MKRVLTTIMFVSLLVSMLTFALNTQSVKASGTVYIRADGSIDPLDAPISTVDNITYTFAGDIDDESIVIERDNIVVDGAGYTLQGTNAVESMGTDLTAGRSNVTIKNMTIKAFYYGIVLNSSSGNSISGNNITENYYNGIVLYSSSNNSISGNSIADNGEGIGFWYSSSYNSISGNSITNSGECIGLYSSSNNSISGNNMTNSGECIGLYSSSNNSISGNNITENYYDGIGLASSSNNSISGNNITETNNFGIFLYSPSPGNSIFHNNFISNAQQVYSNDSANVWDGGYPSGGNYWSDYSGTDADGDRIGDTPYIIDGNNTDHYPLMNPWAPPDIAVADLSASKTIVGQGYTGAVNLTLENQGNKIESFNATAYANSTAIHLEPVMLTMANSTLSFNWNTTGFAYGNYTINAYAEPLLEELDISDNNCTCSIPVHVGVPGDISGPTEGVYDGTTNMRDINYLIRLFNTNPSSPNWKPNADINNDGTVNMRDIQIAILNFNKQE